MVHLNDVPNLHPDCSGLCVNLAGEKEFLPEKVGEDGTPPDSMGLRGLLKSETYATM